MYIIWALTVLYDIIKDDKSLFRCNIDFLMKLLRTEIKSTLSRLCISMFISNISK